MRKLLCLLGLGLVQTIHSHANVIGSWSKNENDTYTYTYSIDNTGGGTVDAWSLELGITPDWDQLDIYLGGGVTVPQTWYALPGTAMSGVAAQDFFALSSDYAVPQGESIFGFSFVSSCAPGKVDFSEFTGVEGGLERIRSGWTVGPGGAPLPDGLVPPVIVAGVFGLVLAARRRP